MKLRALVLSLLAVVLTATSFAQSSAPGDSKKSYVHRLQLADRVRVAVYQEEDLTTTARVDARGMVNLPLLGDVQIGGMTVNEAQDLIQTRYREGRFLRSPQVTVSVEDYAPREVSISGQVRSPGRYALPNESTFTVVELVMKAGGLTDIGKGTAVTVTRVKADGTRETFTVDVESIIKGKRQGAKNDDNSFLLLPGDLVNVPERLI
jgi:polysaccharide export outer membrane protein